MAAKSGPGKDECLVGTKGPGPSLESEKLTEDRMAELTLKE